MNRSSLALLVAATATALVAGLTPSATAASPAGRAAIRLAEPHLTAGTAPAGGSPVGAPLSITNSVPPTVSQLSAHTQGGFAYSTAADLLRVRYGGLVNSGQSVSGGVMNVAIVTYGAWNPAAWRHWRNVEVAAGRLPADVRTPITYQVSKGMKTTTTSRTPDEQELAMDTEVISSIVPRAQIYVFVGKMEAMYQTLAAAAEAHSIQVISDSHGGCDYGYVNTDLASYIHRINVAGVPYLASSGDHGIYCSNSSRLGIDKSGPHANFPAADPEVVAVGGTHEPTSNSASAWEDAVPASKYYWGSGGGLGDFYAMSYQNSTYRAVPDVAADADSDPGSGSGVLTYDGIWSSGGGTSLAAPIWAGIITQVMASRSPSGRIALLPSTTLLSWLYTYHSLVLVDVTHGGNSEIKATTGWDLATGLGTPWVPAILRYLGGAYSGALDVAHRASISVANSAKVIALHHKGSVRFAVHPAGSYTTTLQEFWSGRWHNIASYPTSSAGTLTLVFSGTRRGVTVGRLWVAHLGVASRTFSVRVA